MKKNGRTKGKLTPQQDAFSRAIVSGMTYSEAYRQAYKVADGTKQSSVNERASHTASMPAVKDRIAELMAAAADKAVLDASETLREIRRVALSDIAGIMTPEGMVKLPNELDPATRAAVASFKVDEYGRLEYKFWDKNSALEKAAKVLGLYELDNKQKTDPLKALVDAVTGNVQGVAKGGVDDDE